MHSLHQDLTGPASAPAHPEYFSTKRAGNQVIGISLAVNPGQLGLGGEDGSNNLPQPRITTHLVLRLLQSIWCWVCLCVGPVESE